MSDNELELLQVQGLIKSVVYTTAGHTLGQSDLQDIIQETNLKVLTNTFDPTRGTMAGWVATIARNQAVSALRRFNRHAKPASDAMDSAEAGGDNPDDSDVQYVGLIDMADPEVTDILSTIQRERLMGKIEGTIGDLDPDDLHFLLISLRPDFCYAGYSKEIGKTEVALRVRKHRLVEKLRVMLAQLDS